MAGVLAGVGLLGQSLVVFPLPAQFAIAAGSLAIVVGVAIAIVAATLLDASDLSVGPDPEALVRTAFHVADERSFARSRLDGLLRMYA